MTLNVESLTEISSVAKIFWTGLGAGLGFGAKWFLTKHEIRNLKNESDSHLGEVLQKAQAARREYSTECDNCVRLAMQLVGLMRNNAPVDQVKSLREDLCSGFSHKVIIAYISDFEWQILERNQENDPDELTTVCNDAFKEFDRFAFWLGVINAPYFVTTLNCAPLVIQDRTFRPIDKIMLRLPRHIKNGLTNSFNKAINGILTDENKRPV